MFDFELTIDIRDQPARFSPPLFSLSHDAHWQIIFQTGSDIRNWNFLHGLGIGFENIVIQFEEVFLKGTGILAMLVKTEKHMILKKAYFSRKSVQIFFRVRAWNWCFWSVVLILTWLVLKLGPWLRGKNWIRYGQAVKVRKIVLHWNGTYFISCFICAKLIIIEMSRNQNYTCSVCMSRQANVT